MLKLLKKIQLPSVRSGANINTPNLTGNTALHCAAETGQVETVEFLVNAGAKINVQNAYGQTPVAIATVLRRIK